MAVHNAKIIQIQSDITKENVKKRNFLRSRNLEEAKKCVIKVHNFKKLLQKYENLRNACEAMQQSIATARTLKETVMTLQEVSSVFKGTNHQDWPEKMAKISEQFEVSLARNHNFFKCNFTLLVVFQDLNTNMDINHFMKNEPDEELQNELEKMLEEIEMEVPYVEPPRPNVVPSPLTTDQEEPVDILMPAAPTSFPSMNRRVTTLANIFAV